ncbi:MAG: Hsp20/alpha crystallin family protein [Acidobacteria bacterium ACB1]|nr:Spore protein SP21 [Pyrinomonadaceae bacterium]MCE7961572.1 Hsp20/alpha crystallin family protein [Acidobacteria bacterium ACB1]RIJ92234.1 MAG: molecular chaperone [Acidobacteriota bacterium]
MFIAKYDPFRGMRGLQREMNRMFSDRFDGEEAFGTAWNPKIDIYENADSMVLEAELPGMKREDFELSFENNVLTLKGERRFEKKTDEDNYHRVERAYGEFSRSFTLPHTVTVENAKAEFDNGMLTVTLKKREETKARKIEITGTDTTPTTIDATKSAGA